MYSKLMQKAVDLALFENYSVSMRSGDYTMAVLTKDTAFAPISVRLVEERDEVYADLSFVHGLLTVSTGRFSWPHPRFEQLFESQILAALYRLSSL